MDSEEQNQIAEKHQAIIEASERISRPPQSNRDSTSDAVALHREITGFATGSSTAEAC
jgi:hypothetical protein